MKDLRGVWLLALEEGEGLSGATGKTRCNWRQACIEKVLER